MYDAKHWFKRMKAFLSALAILALIVSSWPAVASATALGETDDSSDPVDISLITRAPEDGQLLLDSCYVLVDFSNEGCDENGDGAVDFAAIPPGTYTVEQTQAPTGFTPIDAFEIQVAAPYPGGSQRIVVKQAPEQNASDTRNFSVILIDSATGERLVSDICVQLPGASNVGCDDDLVDGQIDFLDVPAGVWDLEFTNLGDAWVIGNGPSDAVRIDVLEGTPTSLSVLRGVFRVAPPIAEGATLEITLRGCPEGTDPKTVDPAANCTVPLDAPAEAGVVWGGDGQGGLPMADVTRLTDGTYQVPVPSNAALELMNFEPVAHNEFIAVVSDETSTNGNPVVYLEPGETRRVSLYYYYAAAAESPDTWTASVQVALCEDEMDCRAQAGIVVNISLASGEYLGSCTSSEPQPTSWGTEISTCSVEGMPFDADLMATQDPSTIPAGYAPREETLYLSVGDLIPGGGDQATFTFMNMRTDGGSTEPPASGSATVRITMRGCPEGFDPAVGDFFAECTVPLNAPEAAVILWGGDGQGGMEIMYLDRDFDGAYIYEAGPNTMNLTISGLAPAVRDDYEIFGVDGSGGGSYTINLTDGEVREVYVFYFYN